MISRQESVDALFLAEILATRLCHDLSGQVNALVGAVEMLHEDPSPDAEVITLANDAGESLVRRLRLARAAWGRVAGPIGVEEWRALLDGAPRRGVRIDFDGLNANGSFAPSAARLTLNVILLAIESLPAGGVIEVVGEPEQDIIVRIRGPRAGWPPGLAGMLVSPAEAVEALRRGDALAAARTLQGPLTALIAHATGQRISLLLAPQMEDAPPLLVGLAPLH
jgi:histidine phosphotransferase ChpT